MSIKDEAKQYESVETKNISELDRISVDIATQDKTFTDKEGKDFTITVFEFKGEEYRLPDSVKKQLKVHLEENENLQFFKVKKEGEGLKTTYTVIPL